MLCKECGRDTPAPIYSAVIAPVSPVPVEAGQLPRRGDTYSRWACVHCGRYHFPSGELYVNPYRVASSS